MSEQTPMTLGWSYKMRNRPAMYGTAPEGWTSYDEHVPTDDDPTWGTVTYDRPLTPREMYRYEMTPTYDIPMPLYQQGQTVKHLPTGKLYTVELVNGDYWIKDTWMQTVRDWLMFEPVD